MPIPTRNKLTQMQRARESFISITRHSETLFDEIKKLRDILGEAQNGPPLGKADGSISEETWTRLAELERLGYNFCWHVENVREEKI